MKMITVERKLTKSSQKGLISSSHVSSFYLFSCIGSENKNKTLTSSKRLTLFQYVEAWFGWMSLVSTQVAAGAVHRVTSSTIFRRHQKRNPLASCAQLCGLLFSHKANATCLVWPTLTACFAFDDGKLSKRKRMSVRVHLISIATAKS